MSQPGNQRALPRPADFRDYDTPIWRQACFFGEFGDAFIQNTDLEGAPTEPALVALCDMIAKCCQQNKAELTLFKKNDLINMRSVHSDLQGALDFARSCCSTDEGFVETISRMMRLIDEMEPGDRQVLLGGWASKTKSAHAIVNMVECTGPDTFAWVCCNTGQGIEYHPITYTDYPERKAITALRMDGIDRSRIANPDLWYMILKQTTQASDTHTPETLYEIILPHLLGKDKFELTESDLVESGNWERPQKAGTCYYRCLLSALRYLMKQYDFSPDQQRQLFVYIRVNFLKVVQEHLNRPDFRRTLNESDIYLINLACHETGISAERLSARLDRLMPEAKRCKAIESFLDGIASCCAEVKSLLRESDGSDIVSVVDHESIARCQPNAATAEMVPFTGFDLLFDESDREKKRGYKASGSVPVYLDLLCRVPKPSTGFSLEDHVAIFEWCVDRCDAIRSRSNVTSVTTVLHQLISFVEHVFLSILECPSEFHYGQSTADNAGSNSDSDGQEEESSGAERSDAAPIWKYDGDLSAASQKKGLFALQSISQHYVSAFKSISHDRVTRSTSSFTMGVIYVFFDAILRVKAKSTTNSSNDSIIATLLRNAFGASMDHCALLNKSIFELLSGCYITRPEVAIARNNLFSYQSKMRKRENILKVDNIFKYDVNNQDDSCCVISFQSTNVMANFVLALRAVVDPQQLLEPEYLQKGGVITGDHTLKEISDTEKGYTWFSSDWSTTCPEFAQLRNINYLFQLMMNPGCMFCYKWQQEESNEKVWSTSDARIRMYYSTTSCDRTSVYFLLQFGTAFVNPSIDPLDTPITIESILGTPGPFSETDILNHHNLPSFDNALSPQEAEQFFSYLAFPHIAIPLILNFFTGDRIGLLLNSSIRDIFEAMMMQPGAYKEGSSVDTATSICAIPTPPTAKGLATSLGILMEEILYNSSQILVPMRELCENALALCVGGYKSSVADLLIFLVRQAAVALSMCVYLGIKSEELLDLSGYLATVVAKKIDMWAVIAASDSDVTAAVKLYCHSALLYATAIDVMFLSGPTETDIDDLHLTRCIEGFLCASGYTVSWNGKATSVAGQTESAHGSSKQNTTVSELFSRLQRLKEKITDWSQNHKESINKILDRVVSCSLQRSFSECGGWEQSNREPMVCSIVIENELHPYPPCSSWSQTVSFPGVSSIHVYFDPRSCTEPNADYVLISYPGCVYKFEGPANSSWPGAHGAPPLVIPADSFVVEFQSDGSIQEWGFALTAIAAVSPVSTQILIAETGLSALACQVVLRKCQNLVEAARSMIRERLDEVKMLEEAELALQRQQKDKAARPGLYHDSFDYVQVNIQSAEVFINNRVSIPIPSDFVSHHDFAAVFKGLEVSSCTILGDYTNRFSIQVLCPEEMHGCYEIEAWRPLQPYGVTGSGRSAVIRDDDDKSDNGRCTAYNLPIPATSFEFCGVKYNTYTRASCGWLSELFDKCNLLGSELEGVWCAEGATSLPALSDPVSDLERDARLLLKVHCLTNGQDLVQMIGHPGAWFEILAPKGRRVLLVYALLDHGRRTQRQLVYTTDGKRALRCLQSDPSQRTQPVDPLFKHAMGNIMGGFKDWKGELVSRPGVGPRQLDRVGSLVVRRTRVPILQKMGMLAMSTTKTDSIFCIVGGLVSEEQLLEMENFALEEFLPTEYMSTIVPECLSDKFQFWRTGSRTIRGYHYTNEASTPGKARALGEESLLIVMDECGQLGTVHRLINGKRQHTLIDASSVSDSTFISSISRVLCKVETLSHILIWTTTSFSDIDTLKSCEISRIELPRLCTSLDVRNSAAENADGSQRVDFVLSDHDDLALQFQVPCEINKRWGNLSDFLVFANSSGQYYLFLPNYGFRTPSVLQCPFQSNLIFDTSRKWFENVDTRFYIYPVHPAFTYLEFPDLSAALYWMVLSFARHQYATCAELIRTVCKTDLKLSREQRWILSHVPKTEVLPDTASYAHPDANACRLLLTLLCLDCGENPTSEAFIRQFWDTEKDYKAYVLKISYISQACRLSIDQERALLAIISNVSQIRSGYLDALERLSRGGDNSYEVLPARLQTKACESLNLDDVLKVLDCKETVIKTNRRRTKRNQNVVYSRPSFKSSGDVMAALNSVWSSFEFAVQHYGDFAYSSFLMMYELLTGQLTLLFETSYLTNDGNIAMVGTSFWKPTTENKMKSLEQEVVNTAFTEVKNVQEYLPAAEALFATDLIADVTVDQLASLLCLYEGNSELIIEEYFADADALLEKLAQPAPDTSSEGPYRAQAAILQTSGVLEGLNIDEIEILLSLYEGNSDTAISAYFEDPDDIKSKLVRDKELEKKGDVGADEMSREAAASPTNYPQSWQLVKLVTLCLCKHFPALKKRKEVCIMIALVADIERRVNEITQTGTHTCLHAPPVFPYEENMLDLKSLEGMDERAYESFLNEASSYALKVVYELLYQDEKSTMKQPASPKHKDFIGPCMGHATAIINQPQVSNYSCEKRKLDVSFINADEWGASCSSKDVAAFLSCPLQVLPYFQDITSSIHSQSVTDIPFDLSSHQSALRNPPATDMLSRIKIDLQQSQTVSYFNLTYFDGIDDAVTQEEALKVLSNGCVDKLKLLISDLQTIMAKDMSSVISGIPVLEDAMNGASSSEISIQWRRFQFKRAAGRCCRVWFEYYVASLACTKQVQDIQALNPFLSEYDINVLNSRVIVILMQFVRMRQASTCIHRARVLLKSIRDIKQMISSTSCTDSKCVDSIYVLRHELAELVSELRKERQYIFQEEGGSYLDPRFLIFEFLTGFLLRKRQVELVHDFLAAHKEGRSSVHQMIMGAGKTQVIAPLLSLIMADGESLVTVVCPSPLLQQSRTQFRNRFSSVLQKNVITLKFERTVSDFNSVEGLKKLYQKMLLARSQRSIVLTNPQSIKSMMLKYVDLLLQIRKQPPSLRVFSEDAYTGDLDMTEAILNLGDSLRVFEETSKMADTLGLILKLWGREEKGVALLDEVDMILHPMKSELNFPIGDSEALPLMPQRFELPIYLLDLFLSQREVSKMIHHSSVHLWTEIRGLIEAGREKMFFQSVPHLILLNEKYYFSEMALPISKWALTWMRLQPTVISDLAKNNGQDSSAIELWDDQIVNYIYCNGDKRVVASQYVSSHCCAQTIQLLNLARMWVLVYLPHVISKIHRVSYGLIAEEDVNRWMNQEIQSAGGDKMAGNNVVISKSRRLLAVPFDGKDAPSRTSEFANAEIQIGLSIMAYRLNGLRQRDTKDLITHMKRSFSAQPGPFRGRPSRIQLEEWKAQCVIDANHDEVVSANILEILPLELLQSSDISQLNLIKGTLGNHPNVISYYMSHLVFPVSLEQKAQKIQANGVDLGSDMIFGSRFGFSGTPSDLLPRELQPCHFEMGCEAEVFRVLSSPLIVSVPSTLTIEGNWTVDDLLDRVANGDYSALIDTGALITGYTAEEVARRILKLQKVGKLDKKEVCVFLNEHDVKMAVTVEDGPAIELDRCGAKLEHRFVFYDHVHTTGIDIKHALNATAVCTLGKDMTLRDYAQGCWRMRGLGKGQRIHVLLIKEVSTLIKNTRSTDDLLSDVLAWLLTNSFKSERGQFLQLQMQSLTNVWRRSAYEMLLREKEYFVINRNKEGCIQTTRSKLQNPMAHSEFMDVFTTGQIPREWFKGDRSTSIGGLISPKEDSDIVGSPSDIMRIENDNIQLGIDLFLEPTTSSISDSANLDEIRSELFTMRAQVEAYDVFIKQNSTGPIYVQSIIETVSELLAPSVAHGSFAGSIMDYNDREIVQEQEKEKDEEREKQVFQVVRPENDDDDESGKSAWDVKNLFDYSKQISSLTFFPLKDLVVDDNITPCKLEYPADLLVSQAHVPYFHTSTGRRRLKNVTCVLAWHSDKTAQRTIGADESSSVVTNSVSFLAIAKKSRNKVRQGEVSLSDVNLDIDAEQEDDLSILDSHPNFRCCILSLAEAETLHFIISRRADLRQIASLHCVDSARSGAPLTQPMAMCLDESRDNLSQYHKKFNALLQCARFFNNNMYFDCESLVLLFDSLGASTKSFDREAIFKQTMKGRLRDQSNYIGSPVNCLFMYENKEELLKLRGYCSLFQKCLMNHFNSYNAAFEHFSMGKLRQLGAVHICDGLSRLGLMFLSEAEATAMINYIWNSRLHTEQSVGLGVLDFEMLYPSAATAEMQEMIDLSSNELSDAPGLAPRMIRQVSSQQKVENEFYSRSHAPSIPSIGKWIVIGGETGEAARARLNMSADCKMSVKGIVDANGLVTISPRAVSFKREEKENLWCFEISVISNGQLFIGFASASHQHLPISCVSRSFSTVAAGSVVRIIVNMFAGTVAYWVRNSATIQAGSDNWNEGSSPTELITTSTLDFTGGIYPFIRTNASALFQLNDGGMPFSSLFGNMPIGCHSLFHWIRREQERNYVCHRESLGTFGRISFMSGGQQLEVVKRSHGAVSGSSSTASPGKNSISSDTADDDHVWELMPPKDVHKASKKSEYRSSFPTIFLDGVLLTQGQWYYEVTCGCKNVAVQLGWSDLVSLQSNDCGLGVGDDKHSWAIDGDRRCLWHIDSIAYGKEWKIGDVCGIACNLDVSSRSISFSLNGEWFSPVAFQNIEYAVGLTPALTVQGVQPGDKKALSYTANFGPHFKYPPGGKYRAVSDYINLGRQRFLSPSRALSSHVATANDLGDDLGPSIDDLPTVLPLLSYQASAQPNVVSQEQLRWVPVSIRSGHGQVSIEGPVFSNGPALAVVNKGRSVEGACVRKTVVSTTGHDGMSYPSISGDNVIMRTGKWCYEVDITDITACAACSIGFADLNWNGANWATCKGVGDDAASFGVFFKSGVDVTSNWNSKKRDVALMELAVSEHRCCGISVCVAVDCDEKKMFLSVNNGPVITIFQGIAFSAIVPAISLQARGPTIKLKTKRDAAFPDQTTAELNFGEMPMKNTIFTSTGFSPVLALIIPGP